MLRKRFQFSLLKIHLAIAAIAFALGTLLGGPARLMIVIVSTLFSMLMIICLGSVLSVFAVELGMLAWRWSQWAFGLPTLIQCSLFERRMARLRIGNVSNRVRRVLGRPARIDGFGDRLYWSYRVAGQRYTVSLDPRRLVAKYPNGLARGTRLHQI